MWLQRRSKIFNREKKNRMTELDTKLTSLKAIKNPRQSVKDQIAAIEKELEILNPFVNEEAEQKFFAWLERPGKSNGEVKDNDNGHVDQNNH